MLNNVQRGVFFGGCCLSIVGFYFLGDKLNQWRWGTPAESKLTSAEKAKNGGKGRKKAKLT